LALTKDAGISTADYLVLLELSSRQGTRVAELADALRWERSRLSHHLRRMESRDLIERRPSRQDRRGVEVGIAPAGDEALRGAQPVFARFLREGIFAVLSDEDIGWLVSIADRLVPQVESLSRETGV
jgi:DNA-binding MarR family transcriptional regulator